MTTCELRQAAAKEIETRGWARTTLMDYHGCVCILGALSLALNPDCKFPSFRHVQDSELALNALEEIGFGGKVTPLVDAAWQWNDTKGRTKAEVLARLREGCQ